jgi:tRNA A37 threonylcarbamoyladenosine synthetase subunit TsaC/SUA5/YrdC
VVDCSGERPVVIRAGAVPVEDVAAVLDRAGVEHGLG